jgi:CHAT domain-containing protein
MTYVALGDPSLPGVAMEMRLLAGRATLLHGAAATRQALAHALRRPGTVHVAGHGFVPANVPALGGVRLADGWFGTTDVPPDVAADLVILAACRTGSERGAAARAWGGLPATLLAAGARRVLWTTDDVDDAVGSELTLRLHGALRKARPEEAYGRAVAELWDDASLRVFLFPFRMSGVMP